MGRLAMIAPVVPSTRLRLKSKLAVTRNSFVRVLTPAAMTAVVATVRNVVPSCPILMMVAPHATKTVESYASYARRPAMLHAALEPASGERVPFMGDTANTGAPVV